MLGSEVLFWLGRPGGHGGALTTGTVGAWWCFFAYKAREHRQERDGLEFESGDLAGPLLNAVMYSIFLVLWIYYSLVWRW